MLIAVTTLEKIKAVPPKIWTNIGLGVLVFIAAIILYRKAAQMNKILLAVILFVVVSVYGVNWVYNRTEPAFLTPIVDKIAPFFPSGVK